MHMQTLSTANIYTGTALTTAKYASWKSCSSSRQKADSMLSLHNIINNTVKR